jgi:peptidoglycan-associated lipoprotein
MSSIPAILAIFLTILTIGHLTNPPQWKKKDFPKGIFTQKIFINSQPTSAQIFINNKKAGHTPLTTYVWHGEADTIHIKAVPFNDFKKMQYEQNIIFEMPSIPRKLLIYMNEPPALDLISIPTEDQKIVYLKKLIDLPVIYFDFDKANLKFEFHNPLNQVIAFLKENPLFNVILEGYADERGSVDYNYPLSLRRARAVRHYLVSNGIDKNRIRIFGHGKITTVNLKGIKVEYSVNRKVVIDVYLETKPAPPTKNIKPKPQPQIKPKPQPAATATPNKIVPSLIDAAKQEPE